MEEQIAKDVLEALDKAGDGEFVEISLAPFLHSWANGKTSLSDNEVSKGLLQFAKTYNVDYVWVLSGGINVQHVLRFWKKSPPAIPEIITIGEQEKEN